MSLGLIILALALALLLALALVGACAASLALALLLALQPPGLRGLATTTTRALRVRTEGVARAMTLASPVVRLLGAALLQ